MVSKNLLIAIKLHAQPAYRLAQKAGVNPCVLSKLLTGYQPVKIGDKRILAVGKLLGFDPQDCFEREVASNVR